MFAARTLMVSVVVVFADLGWASDVVKNGTNDTDFYDFVPVTETTTTMDMTTTISENKDNEKEKTDNETDGKTDDPEKTDNETDGKTDDLEKTDNETDGKEKTDDQTDNKEAKKVHSVEVTGEAVMTVNNPEEFVNSAAAKLGVQKAIALKAGVDDDKVEVTLSLVESEGRRLSTGSVKIEFTITLPAGSGTEAASKAEQLQETMDSISTDELGTAIVEAVAAETGVTYEVEVQQFTSTATAVVEEIAPSTPTAADDDDAEDDDDSATDDKTEDDDGNRQSQVCVVGAALVFWQVFA